MKIKTLLTTAVILSVIILISVGSWVYSLNKAYSEMKDDTYIAQKISSAIFRINTLSSEYLLYYQDRVSHQWKNAHSELGNIFTDAEIYHVSAFVDLYKVIQSHERLQTLFVQLEEINNTKITPLSVQRRKALGSQMLTIMQILLQASTELVNAVEVKRKKVEQQILWLALIIFIVFIVTLLLSWLVIANRIILPVNNLKNYIVNVDASNLDEKYIFNRKDEVGELIESFNRMAGKLFKTTVSKQKLMDEIDERKRSEEELIRQTNLSKSILENTGNVIVVLDREGNFIKFNRAAEDVTGYSRYEVLYKPVWDYVIPQEQKAGVKNVFKNLKDGKVDMAGNYENHWKTRSGDYRLFDWHNDVLRDAENEVKYIVAVGHDITDKRKDELEKQRMQRELEQAQKMEALGQLTGGVAHDFNNMLGIILGYSELAINKVTGSNDSAIKNYLEQVITASNRAKELIAKMLTFSRIDDSVSETVNPDALLTESIDLMKSILPSSIKLEVEIENNLPMIVINPVQFQQVIMNLMVNAKDAMDGIGIINIRASLYHSSGDECSSCHQKVKGDWVEIQVEDSGCGIPDDIHGKIFEPFFTTKEVGEGTGMGLSMIHGIVKANGGHIIIKSTVGMGTSFHLLFPLSVSSPGVTAAEHVLPDIDITKGEGKRILIVDDQESLVDLQYDLLSNAGYVCSKKYNSQKALELYLSSPDSFDLIITDQTMPDLTGLELISAIRQKGLNIPIIIETGYSDKIKDAGLDISNVTLLKKPVSSKELLSCIAKIFSE